MMHRTQSLKSASAGVVGARHSRIHGLIGSGSLSNEVSAGVVGARLNSTDSVSSEKVASAGEVGASNIISSNNSSF